MTTQEQVLDYYQSPATMDAGGQYAALFDRLPADVAGLSRAIQGLLIHNYWTDSYGVTVPEARGGESHLRAIEPMLRCLLAEDDRPLDEARPPERRLIGVCRHFALVFVAALRAKGIPARARCGFGAYFQAGEYVDHWVGEYWHADEGRWVLVDPQLDEVQCRALGITFDPLDVPRDQFVIGGDAWARCRAGAADPERFGIMELRGLWFVAGDLVRDVAALNKVEMLPWDVWGAMPEPGQAIGDELLAFLDHLAALTADPDANFGEVRALYEGDERLHVPATVYNSVRQRVEAA